MVAETMQYRDSKDPKVAATAIVVRTGRKWNASRELLMAGVQLRQ